MSILNNSYFVLFLAAISFSLFAFYVTSFLGGEDSFENRNIRKRLNTLMSRSDNLQLLKSTRFSNIPGLDHMFKRQRMTQKLSELLVLSGWKMPLSIFIFLDLLWGAVVFLLIRILSPVGGPASFLTAFFAVLIPYWYLVINKRRYILTFSVNLADALTMIKNALRAGQGIQAGLQIVASDGPKPVSTEFAEVVREIELGTPVNEALNALYKKIKTVDLRILILGITIQQEVGGNLAELIDKIETTIRGRISLSRELKALTAQGKMTGIVLSLLPFFVAAAVTFMNPNYFEPLLKTDLGHKVLGGALFSQAIGTIIIRKITNPQIIA